MDENMSIADATFKGEENQDESGFSVAGAGDVNGDGYDDILIGARETLNGRGETYLVLGKASGMSKDTDLVNSDASFVGENPSDNSGQAICGAGDVNGDGFDDIFIGAYRNSEGGSVTGQTYLVLGKASGWAMDTDLSNADASFWGENQSDFSGQSIAGLGDVNGDGYDDLLIGAYGNDDNGSYAGQTYLILGKAAGWVMNTGLSNADASFWGEDAYDYSGISVARAGDVNGDGFNDILIAATGGGPVGGEVYVIFGRASGWVMDTGLSTADASFVGESSGDESGYSIAGAGDVNGDGYDDVLIGSYKNDDGGSDAGQTYLILGKPSGWAMDTDLSNADASFWGEHTEDYSSLSIAGAGDVNGDGYDDILIGAYLNDDGGWAAGQSYLILGKTSGWGMDTDLFNADASFWGDNPYDNSGRSVAGTGDVNGDGYDDILIGAPGNDDGGDNAGMTYLIFPFRNTPPTTITSVKAYTDDTGSTEVLTCVDNDNIYIELKGADGNPSRKDVAYVNVTSNESYPIGFIISLCETGPNTGVYRGNFTVKDQTHEMYRWLQALAGENIIIKSVQDETKHATLFVGPMVIFGEDDSTAIEDELYSQQYWTYDWPDVTWTFATNATWLEWGVTTHTISGIPKNEDIGDHWVRINISFTTELSDEHYFILSVQNTNDPPMITTSDVTTCWEDLLYHVDYDASDVDPTNDELSWELMTDAKFLYIDSELGVISGTPENGDIGEYTVNASVSDDNGGVAYTEFTLTVLNTNDRPLITGEDITEAYEDELYVLSYDVEDADLDDTVFDWVLTTYASWLHIGDGNYFTGTPTNDDVGTDDVNISVTDGHEAYDFREFVLIVHNTNDAPVWADLPESTNFTAGKTYIFDVNATDIDIGDELTYALDIDRSPLLSFDTETGVLQWTTDEDDVGAYIFNLSVTDGEVTIFREFVITVTLEGPGNVPPVVEDVEDVTVEEGQTVSVSVLVTDDDGDTITFSKFDGPDGAHVDDNGRVTWQTAVGDAGTHEIVIKVTDGNYERFVSFRVVVTAAPPDDNGDPVTVPPSKEGSNTMMFAILIVIILVVVIMVVALLLSKKKVEEEEEKEKALDAEEVGPSGAKKLTATPMTTDVKDKSTKTLAPVMRKTSVPIGLLPEDSAGEGGGAPKPMLMPKPKGKVEDGDGEKKEEGG